MIRVNNLHIPLSYNDDTLRKKLCRELKIKDSDIKSLSLFRRSVDARKKDNIYFLCSVDAQLYSNENTALKKCKNAVKTEPYSYTVPEWKGTISPLVVGAGPAGLFAALILAQSGAKPIAESASSSTNWSGIIMNFRSARAMISISQQAISPASAIWVVIVVISDCTLSWPSLYSMSDSLRQRQIKHAE